MTLTPQQLEHYREHGYVLASGLFAPNVMAQARAESHALAARISTYKKIEATWDVVRRDDAMAAPKSVLHCHDVQFHSASLLGLMLDDAFTAAAASIIGPNVQLHHSKMFIKPPEVGAPFPLHQDAPYFPHQQDSVMAAIIHLDDAPVERGCVCVVPGSHRQGIVAHHGPKEYWVDEEDVPFDRAIPLPAKAGDVLFFSYLLLHGSGVNASSEARTTLLVQMRDPSDPPLIRIHESRGQGMMLRGIDPTCSTTRPLSDDEADNPTPLKPVAHG